MATVHFKAHKHHKKADGTINVKLVIYHKGKRVYPDTAHYITEKDLTKKYEFKDKDLITKLTIELGEYRKKIGELGERLKGMTAADVADYLLRKPSDSNSVNIDFISFGWGFVKELKDEGKDSAYKGIRSVLNNFTDFTKLDEVYTTSITSDLLRGFEKYLKKPHKQTRYLSNGQKATRLMPGVSDATFLTVMSWFKLVFNAIRDKYNDEDRGIIRIQNYPFRKLKLKSAPPAKKRAIPINYVKAIRDCDVRSGSVAELFKDIFMLSFYLCGMNAKDMFLITDITGDRISYNRSKTRSKRKDSAFISIKKIPEAALLVDKYFGNINKRYSSIPSFQSAIFEGSSNLKKILEVSNPELDLEKYKLDFYAARHTFATEARNTCGFSVSDVGEALNHSQPMKITDTYIVRDWGTIDKIQEQVVLLLS
ncbi:phage integrase SAM-like domain-containing protein [Pedobacter nyackensis]|uniref:Phage integrase SAM-like domain-containing protein n=1 Tax=Pedobacter nyackensis TaxID=475255 RepID=A0A1W1ZW75_9SPHI|nr:phage integrase SAM-like domain-containing protein [Pedobacter nyackensis]SMC52318.1 Phage integrase SAM-like domain-containing protein [Pedobacter nyackensis]